jgi:hypothetical protein
MTRRLPSLIVLHFASRARHGSLKRRSELSLPARLYLNCIPMLEQVAPLKSAVVWLPVRGDSWEENCESRGHWFSLFPLDESTLTAVSEATALACSRLALRSFAGLLANGGVLVGFC